MDKRLEMVLDRVSTWPEEAQAELLEHIIEIETKHFGVHQLSEDERAGVQRGLEEMRQGKFATDEEVEAVFKRYR